MNKEQELNTRLSQILKSQGITNFYITVLGNSLATGYSMANKTIPLLERNHSLKEILMKKNIIPIVRTFTRMENNNDEILHSWYHLSESEKERLKFNRHDAKKLKYFTPEELEQYYSLDKDHDDKIQDILNHSKEEDANILIYSGATGSFLDNVTRGGLPKKALSGFKRDFKYLEATLKEIWNENNKTGKKTQVYLCGVPNYKKLNLTEYVINRRLKHIAKKYSNVVYVDAVYGSLIYKNGIDVHLSEEEYNEYNNAITESVCENYVQTNNKINIDKDMYNLAQIVMKEMTNKETDIDKIILDYLSKYLPSLEGLDYDCKEYVENIKTYIYNVLPRELKEYPNNIQDETLKLEMPEIIVCNALTGEVTTNADTTINKRILGTSDEDFIDIETLMTNTLFENRKQGKNIQMYVIGTGNPKVDKQLKSIIENYINVNYISPINPLTQNSTDEEKQLYNKEVNDSIKTDYEQTRLQIEIDRKLTQINEEIELLSDSKENIKRERKLVVSKVNKYTRLLKDKKGLRRFLLERAPYDFYYIGKKEIKNATK